MTPLDDALLHAKKATISADKWIGKIDADVPYNHTGTEWYKALKALEQAAHPPAPQPAPTPTPSAISAQRMVFMSGTVETPADWLAEYLATPNALILFSADLNESEPGQAYYVTDSQLARIKNAGRAYGWWCDGTDTPASEAKRLLATRGGVCVVLQWENDAQYDALVNSGVGLGVGDAANLTGPRLNDAIARANRGELRLTGEMMWCNTNYSAMGIPIQSVTLYVDRDNAQGGYQPLSAYAPLSAGLRASCCLYTGGRATPADWALWRSWVSA